MSSSGRSSPSTVPQSLLVEDNANRGYLGVSAVINVAADKDNQIPATSFVKIKIPGDGNCGLTAIALGLINLIASNKLTLEDTVYAYYLARNFEQQKAIVQRRLTYYKSGLNPEGMRVRLEKVAAPLKSLIALKPEEIKTSAQFKKFVLEHATYNEVLALGIFMAPSLRAASVEILGTRVAQEAYGLLHRPWQVAKVDGVDTEYQQLDWLCAELNVRLVTYKMVYKYEPAWISSLPGSGPERDKFYLAYDEKEEELRYAVRNPQGLPRRGCIKISALANLSRNKHFTDALKGFINALKNSNLDGLKLFLPNILDLTSKEGHTAKKGIALNSVTPHAPAKNPTIHLVQSESPGGSGSHWDLLLPKAEYTAAPAYLAFDLSERALREKEGVIEEKISAEASEVAEVSEAIEAAKIQKAMLAKKAAESAAQPVAPANSMPLLPTPPKPPAPTPPQPASSAAATTGIAGATAALDLSASLQKVMNTTPFSPKEAMELVCLGAKKDVKDHRGNSLLHLLVKDSKNNNHIETLIKTFSMSINIKNEASGRTPLLALFARRPDAGKLAFVQWLITKGADFNAKDKQGLGALHLCAKANDVTVGKWLILNSMDLKVKDLKGNTPLFHACSRGSLAFAKMLVAAGASLKDQNNKKETLLHAAISSNNLDMVTWLVESKQIDVTAIDYSKLPANLKAYLEPIIREAQKIKAALAAIPTVTTINLGGNGLSNAATQPASANATAPSSSGPVQTPAQPSAPLPSSSSASATPAALQSASSAATTTGTVGATTTTTTTATADSNPTGPGPTPPLKASASVSATGATATGLPSDPAQPPVQPSASAPVPTSPAPEPALPNSGSLPKKPVSPPLPTATAEQLDQQQRKKKELASLIQKLSNEVNKLPANSPDQSTGLAVVSALNDHAAKLFSEKSTPKEKKNAFGECQYSVVTAHRYFEISNSRSVANVLANIALFLLGAGVLYLLAATIHYVDTQRFTFFHKPPLRKELPAFSALLQSARENVPELEEEKLSADLPQAYREWSSIRR